MWILQLSVDSNMCNGLMRTFACALGQTLALANAAPYLMTVSRRETWSPRMNLDHLLSLRSKAKRHRGAGRSLAGTYSFSHRCSCDLAKPAERIIRGRWIIAAPMAATDVPRYRPANRSKRRCEELSAFASHRAARSVAEAHEKISLRSALRTRRR
jgi:hypothetical protein